MSLAGWGRPESHLDPAAANQILKIGVSKWRYYRRRTALSCSDGGNTNLEWLVMASDLHVFSTYSELFLSGKINNRNLESHWRLDRSKVLFPLGCCDHSCTQHAAITACLTESQWHRALFLAGHGQVLSIGELQLRWEYIVNQGRNSENTFLWKQKDRCHFVTSQSSTESSHR